MRAANPDEAVHDAPDGAEKPDKGGYRPDRRQHARSPHVAAGARLDARQRQREALLEPSADRPDERLSSSTAALQIDRAHSSTGLVSLWRAASSRVRVLEKDCIVALARFATMSSRPLTSQSVHVIMDAKASPTIIDFTTMSASMNIDQGERSCGSGGTTAEGRRPNYLVSARLLRRSREKAAPASDGERQCDPVILGAIRPTLASPTGRRLATSCSSLRVRFGVAQALEAGELIGEQFPLFIAGDKDLEHRAAVDIDELQRAGPAPEEGPVDEIDRRASLDAQVAAERALSVNIEIAARLAPGGSGAFVSNTPSSVWTMNVTGPQSRGRSRSRRTARRTPISPRVRQQIEHDTQRTP